jgi:hypothetical protein
VVIVVDQHPLAGRLRGPEYVAVDLGVGMDALVFTVEETRDWSRRFRREVEEGLLLFRRREA